jgi:hypothetical protein
VNHDQRSVHENVCNFLPVECLAGMGEEVVKCGWQGKKSDLLEHVDFVHGYSFVHRGSTIRNFQSGRFDKNFIKVTLLCVSAELFWMTVKQDIDNNTRLEVVQYIGSKKKAAQFEYQHELKSVDGKIAISFLSVTENLYEDINAIFAFKRCFTIDLNFFKKLFATCKERVPEYKVTVRKALATP